MKLLRCGTDWAIGDQTLKRLWRRAALPAFLQLQRLLDGWIRSLRAAPGETLLYGVLNVLSMALRGAVLDFGWQRRERRVRALVVGGCWWLDIGWQRRERRVRALVDMHRGMCTREVCVFVYALSCLHVHACAVCVRVCVCLLARVRAAGACFGACAERACVRACVRDGGLCVGQALPCNACLRVHVWGRRVDVVCLSTHERACVLCTNVCVEDCRRVCIHAGSELYSVHARNVRFIRTWSGSRKAAGGRGGNGWWSMGSEWRAVGSG